MSESGLKGFWLRIILRIYFVQLWMTRLMDNPPTAAAQLRVTVQHSCQAYDLCTKHIPSSACFPRSVCWSQPLLTNPHDTSDPVYRITKFGRGDQWQLVFCFGQYSLMHVTVVPPDTIAHWLHLPGIYSHWNAFFPSRSWLHSGTGVTSPSDDQ